MFAPLIQIESRNIELASYVPWQGLVRYTLHAEAKFHARDFQHNAALSKQIAPRYRKTDGRRVGMWWRLQRIADLGVAGDFCFHLDRGACDLRQGELDAIDVAMRGRAKTDSRRASLRQTLCSG